jgi:hypothetical protein
MDLQIAFVIFIEISDNLLRFALPKSQIIVKSILKGSDDEV